MVTLEQVLENFESHDDSEMKRITDIITGLLANEKTKVERKVAQEEEQVKKLKERLRSLQENPKDDGTNLNLSDTEQIWKHFDLQRTGVIDEIGGNRDEQTVCLTDKENTSLGNIANAALSLCAEEFKNQKENVLAALTGKPVELSSNELKELRNEIETFQLELESDLVPYLLENLCKSLSETNILPLVITKIKSDWILKINQSEDIKLKGSRCEKYMKACIKVCWILVKGQQEPAKFVWEVNGNEKAFKCLTTSCKKQKSCERRVCRPAVYRGSDISEGKYTCMSCTPGNTPERNESAKSDKKQNRKSAPVNTTAEHDAGKQRKSTSSTAAPFTNQPQKGLDF